MDHSSMTQVICFHGSPGTAEEFSQVQALVTKCRIVSRGRSSAEQARSGDFAGEVLLGYSWGAAEALLRATESKEPPRALVLVAPYVFAPPVSLLKRLLVQAPLLGRIILNAAGPGQMKSMAEKCASPAALPEAYQKYCMTLAKPELLAQAVLEKHGKEARIGKAMAELGRRRTPVLLIWGAGDLTSSEAAQIMPLRQALAIRNEFRLKSAGHAIPWTHSADLARTLDEFIETLREEA